MPQTSARTLLRCQALEERFTPAYTILFQPGGPLQNMTSVFQNGATTFTAVGDDASLPVSELHAALQLGNVTVTSAAGGSQSGEMIWATDFDIDGIGSDRTLTLAGFNDVGGPYLLSLDALTLADSDPGGDSLSLVLTANAPGGQLSIGSGTTIGAGIKNITLDGPSGGVVGEASITGASINISGNLSVSAESAQINASISADTVALFGNGPSLSGNITANTVSVSAFDQGSNIQAQITGNLVTDGEVDLTGSITGVVTSTAGTGELVKFADVTANSIEITAKLTNLQGTINSASVDVAASGGSTTIAAAMSGGLQVIGGAVTVSGSVSGVVDLKSVTNVNLKDVTFGLGSLTIQTSGTVTTEGQVESGGTIEIDSATFSNTGTLAGLSVDVATTGSLTSSNNAGVDLTEILADDNLILSAQGALAVEKLYAANFAISLAGSSVTVLGPIDTDGILAINASGSSSFIYLEEDVEVDSILLSAGQNSTVSLLGLVVSNAFSAGSIDGTIRVFGSLRIFGQGSVGADLVLEDQGYLAFDGPLTVTGDVQFLNGSTYAAALNPPSLLEVSGTTTIAAGAVLTLSGNFAPPTATILTANAGLSGQFNTLNLPQGTTAAYSATKLSIAGLVAVPGNVLSSVDEDGTPFTVRLTGPGSLSAFNGLNGMGFVVTGSTSTSRLTVTSKGNATAGLIDIESISVDGSMNSISVPKADILGSVSVSGSLKLLTVRDLFGDLNVGGFATDKTTIRGRNVTGNLLLNGGLASLAVANMTGDIVAASGGALTVSGTARGEWLFDGIVKSLRAAELVSLDFTADALGSLLVPGNAKLGVSGDILNSQFRLLGNPTDPKKIALGTMKAAGTVMGSTIDAMGNVSSVTVGRFIDSNLWIGYSGALAATFTDPATFTGTFKLGSFVTTARPLGLPSSWAFQRSQVVAAELGTVKLSAVNVAAIDAFGLKFRDSFGKVTVGVAIGTKAANTPPHGRCGRSCRGVLVHQPIGGVTHSVNRYQGGISCGNLGGKRGPQLDCV